MPFMHDYKLALLKVPVSNINNFANFYEKALGFEPEFVAEEYGWAQFKAGGTLHSPLRSGHGRRQPQAQRQR